MEEKRFLVLLLLFGLCHAVSKAAECTTRGRFPNDEVENCRGYTMCLNSLNGFTQYKLKCPAGSIYSHIEQQCTNSTEYQCLPTYNCTTIGNIVNPASENCTSFLACVQGLNETVTARWVQCSHNLVFNPLDGLCVNETEYKCPTRVIVVPDVVEDNDVIIKANVTFNNAVNSAVSTIFFFTTALLLVL